MYNANAFAEFRVNSIAGNYLLLDRYEIGSNRKRIVEMWYVKSGSGLPTTQKRLLKVKTENTNRVINCKFA